MCGVEIRRVHLTLRLLDVVGEHHGKASILKGASDEPDAGEKLRGTWSFGMFVGEFHDGQATDD